MSKNTVTYAIPENLAELNREELLDERDRCMKAIIDIDGQLEFDALKDQSDAPWRIKAKTARRHAAREMQAIDRQLARKGSNRTEKHFVKAAKRNLSLDQFTMLLEAARESAKQEAESA